MNFSKPIIFLAMLIGYLLLAVHSSTAEIDDKKQKYQDLLDTYRETHLKIINELQDARKNSAEIAMLLKEEKLSDLFSEKYALAMGIALVHSVQSIEYSEKMEKQISEIEKAPQKKIESVLGDTISIYKGTLDCFDNETYTRSAACEKFKKICGDYGSDNGDMYYYKLTNELELRKIDVSENDPGSEDFKGASIFQKDRYQFCRLLSITSSPFSPKSIKKDEPGMDPLFIKDFYGYVSTYQSQTYSSKFHWKKICIDEKPSEERVKRLLDLKSQFPEDWTIKKYYDSYEEWKPACGEAAQEICKNTYILKDQIILTYVTVACEKRDVTREDIKNDIFRMDSHADKLKHSTLLDEIDICQKAHDNGFSWFYKEPTPSSLECKKEGPKTPKKRK